ncbi:hypothetical protein [Streptomyces cremeus]|uniref:hypothetical protein n=1 Tax=Streptomyces cremeus TaxID=66881 RepID=UPI0031EF3D86
MTAGNPSGTVTERFAWATALLKDWSPVVVSISFPAGDSQVKVEMKRAVPAALVLFPAATSWSAGRSE